VLTITVETPSWVYCFICHSGDRTTSRTCYRPEKNRAKLIRLIWVFAENAIAIGTRCRVSSVSISLEFPACSDADMQSALSTTPSPEVVTNLVLATSAMLFSAVAAVLLDGSPNSHARFPAWMRHCQSKNRTTTTTTMSFDFETERASCLVFYADNGHEFIEVRLMRGTAMLRLGAGRALTVGSGLNDGRTHSVTLGLTDHEATLTVDRASQSLSVVSPSRPPSTPADFSVYVGGLPSDFRSGQRLEELSAPSAAFEPSFVGSVRNLAYTTQCGSDVEVVRVMSGSGIRSGLDDPCADYDPCQNSAPCLSTDEGPLCDCTVTDYVGPFCALG